MTTQTRKTPSLVPIWLNIAYAEIDEQNRIVPDGHVLSCPVLTDRGLPDPLKPIRLYIGVSEGDGFYSQECIGPDGYYYSDGAGCHDTSHKFEPLARNHYFNRTFNIAAVLTFQETPLGEIATLTHLRRNHDPYIRRFLRQGPAQKI